MFFNMKFISARLFFITGLFIEGLKLDDLYSPFQPMSFYDSNSIVTYYFVIHKCLFLISGFAARNLIGIN